MIKETPLYKQFAKFSENNQANLLEIAMKLADLYVDKYVYSNGGEYIKAFKKYDLAITLLIHLGNSNTRGQRFAFDDEIKKSDIQLNKIRRFVYNRWKNKRLICDDSGLNHLTSELQNLYNKLVFKFTPYNVEDRQKLKNQLGIKR